MSNPKTCAKPQFNAIPQSAQLGFAEWVENNIGVLDLSLDLPIDIKFDPEEIKITKGDLSLLLQPYLQLEILLRG